MYGMVTHFGAEKSPVFFFLSCIIKFYSQIKLFKKKKVSIFLFFQTLHCFILQL